MPLYDYLCKTCLAEAEVIKGSPLTDDEQVECMFETRHGMNPTEKELASATECPRCHSHDTVKTYHGVRIESYVRGYGYLDRVGCNRDMNIWKLTVPDEDGNSQDPYGYMRERGEADDLVHRLRKGGKHQPHTQHFPVHDASAAKAVKDVPKIV